jgi:hypothetical protein
MPEPSFVIHMYPDEGAGDGFTVAHPYREGSITVRTEQHRAATIPGASSSDHLWRITLTVHGAAGGTTAAKISDAGALSDTSPVKNYNLVNIAFRAHDGVPDELEAKHCCRQQDYIDIEVTTDWRGVEQRRIVLGSVGEIMR